jgi:hypothetical protein
MVRLHAFRVVVLLDNPVPQAFGLLPLPKGSPQKVREVIQVMRLRPLPGPSSGLPSVCLRQVLVSLRGLVHLKKPDGPQMKILTVQGSDGEIASVPAKFPKRHLPKVEDMFSPLTRIAPREILGRNVVGVPRIVEGSDGSIAPVQVFNLQSDVPEAIPSLGFLQPEPEA